MVSCTCLVHGCLRARLSLTAERAGLVVVFATRVIACVLAPRAFGERRQRHARRLALLWDEELVSHVWMRPDVAAPERC